MRSNEINIAFFLSSFGTESIIKGFKIWNEGIEKGLDAQHWKPQKNKPKGEYILLNNEYWVQDKEFHQKLALESLQKRKDFRKRMECKDKNKQGKGESGFIEKARKLFDITWLGFGPKVSDNIYEKRLKICKACSYVKIKDNKMYCKPCGCPTWKPAELTNKLKWARLECPKGFFKSVE